MSREDIPNILIRFTNVTGYNHSQESNLAFKAATEEIERLLAAEREKVLGEILAFNTQLGCTPQEGYKDLAGALRDTKHLIARAQRDAREPMKCKHPKACAPPCDFCKGSGRAIDLAAGVYGGQLRKPCPLCHGAGLSSCSACAEREKVREMCAKYLEGEAAKDATLAEAGTPFKTLGQAMLMVAARRIRQLSLTKLDEGEK